MVCVLLFGAGQVEESEFIGPFFLLKQLPAASEGIMIIIRAVRVNKTGKIGCQELKKNELLAAETVCRAD